MVGQELGGGTRSGRQGDRRHSGLAAPRLRAAPNQPFLYQQPTGLASVCIFKTRIYLWCHLLALRQTILIEAETAPLKTQGAMATNQDPCRSKITTKTRYLKYKTMLENKILTIH